MGVRLNGTSSTLGSLSNAPELRVWPVTFGFWFKPTVAVATQRVLFDYWSASGGAVFVRAVLPTSNGFGIQENEFGAAAKVVSNVIIPGRWHFAVVRWIADTNRRASLLAPAAGLAVQHVAATEALSAYSYTSIGLGTVAAATLTANADVAFAEYWAVAGDVQPDGGQLSDALMRRLAYEGPFSAPAIARRVIEYRSFYSSRASNTDRPDEVFSQSQSPAIWTGTALETADHPQLAPNYRRPTDFAQRLMI